MAQVEIVWVKQQCRVRSNVLKIEVMERIWEVLRLYVSCEWTVKKYSWMSNDAFSSQH